MKFSTMSAKDRRALMLGLGILLPAFFFIWGVKPFRATLADAQEQLATGRDALSRERAAVAAALRNPQLQHVADSAMRAMTPRLFNGRDDVMASADLVTYLGQVAHTSRVWLQDASTRPATTSPSGVRTLHVEIRAESDLAGLLRLLQALEHGKQLVRVDRLDISRTLRGQSDGGMETLSIAASITGYAINGEAGADTVAHAAAPLPSLGHSVAPSRRWCLPSSSLAGYWFVPPPLRAFPTPRPLS
jgi:hypothetical protein